MTRPRRQAPRPEAHQTRVDAILGPFLTGDELRAAVLAGLSEKEFTQRVIDRARALGWRCYHTWRSDHSAAGFPDLVMVRSGRALFVEVKVKGRPLSDKQVEWLAALELVKSVEARAIWPEDWGHLCELLEPR